MPNIPRVGGLAPHHNSDQIPPYKFTLIKIYKLLLYRGETVLSCKPVPGKR